MPRKGQTLSKRHGMRWQSIQPYAMPSGPMAEDGEFIDIGGSLRQFREERGLTIRALAEISGLAVNTLSLIENSKCSPSVSTLKQLAGALDVPITAFFGPKPKNHIAHIKANCRRWARCRQGAIEDLGAGASIRAVEPFILTLEANADSAQQEIVHTGYEFVYCLEGRIAYTIQWQVYILEQGDSLLFEAVLPHSWQNLSPSTSRSILVLIPTDANDKPSARHFLPE
mgnify:CR=1 FL=1